MTIQAETHIECLGILVHIHLGQIAMASFTIDPCRDMRTVVVMHKIGHDYHRDPLERFVIFHGFDQRFQLFATLRDRQLLDSPSTWSGLAGQPPVRVLHRGDNTNTGHQMQDDVYEEMG